MHSPAHDPLHLPDLQLLVDAVRGPVFTHGARVGLHIAEQPAGGHDGDRLGHSARHHDHIRASSQRDGRGRGAGNVSRGFSYVFD